jgi:hypothetical protein
MKLTIGKPIQTIATTAITHYVPMAAEIPSMDDPFYEQIAGAYDLFALQVSPEKMIHFMYGEGEIPGSGSGILNEIGVSNTEITRNALINVINNIANRIVMTNEDNFSYRDEIYIENALRKMGITNTQLFLREAVSSVREGDRIQRLLALYENNESRLTLLEGAETPSFPAKDDIADGEKDTRIASESAANMFLDVMNRLDVQNLTKQLNDYHSMATLYGNVSNSDILFAPYLRMGDESQIITYRDRFFGDGGALLIHRENAFETQDELPEPTRESEQVARVTAAVLLRLIGSAAERAAARPEFSGTFAIQAASVLPEEAERTLERLRIISSETVRKDVLVRERLFATAQERLTEVEESLLTSFAAESENIMERLSLIHISEKEMPEDSEMREATRVTEHSLITLAENYRDAFSEIRRERIEIDHLHFAVLDAAHADGQITDAVNTAAAIEAVSRARRVRGFDAAPDAGQSGSEESETPDEATMFIPPGPPSREMLDAIDQKNREAAARYTSALAEAEAGRAAERPVFDKDRTMREGLAGLEAPDKLIESLLSDADESGTRSQTLTPEATRILAKTEEGNREFYEKLLIYMNNPSPEHAKALRLAAGDHFAGGEMPKAGEFAREPIAPPQGNEPERETIHTIERYLDRAVRTENKRILHGSLPPMLPAKADAAVRMIYEELIREISSGAGEQAAPERVRRVLTQGAAFQKSNRKKTDLKLHAAEAVRIHRTPPGQAEPERTLPETKTEPQAGETVTNVTHTENIEHRTMITETEIHHAINEATAKNAEEINTLIGRALSSQIDQISNRVYSRMERQLGMERARRGK